MGMGYSAVQLTVIENEELERLLPKEYGALLFAIEEIEDYSLDELARDIEYEYSDTLEDAEFDKLSARLDILCRAFHDRTGLYLHIGCHPSEDIGSRYDQVTGQYFEVSGVYELTPAAKKLKEEGVRFADANFVQYG